MTLLPTGRWKCPSPPGADTFMWMRRRGLTRVPRMMGLSARSRCRARRPDESSLFWIRVFSLKPVKIPTLFGGVVLDDDAGVDTERMPASMR